MAVDHMNSVWTRDKYFSTPSQNKGNPTSTTPGIGQTFNILNEDGKFPCSVSQFEGLRKSVDGGLPPQKEEPSAAILTAFPNVRYKNMSQKKSNRKMINMSFQAKEINKLMKSNFFSKPEDGEKSNRKQTVNISLDNPEFLLSKINDKDAKTQLNNTNSIQKQWNVDGGMGVFEYESKNPDNVQMIIDSNASYVAQRDRFFIEDGDPPKGSSTEDLLRRTDEQLQKIQASISSIPSRQKRNVRKRGNRGKTL